MSHERRQITPEQAQYLERFLNSAYGPPKIDRIAVGEDGTITTSETWGDEVTTTTRRTPITGPDADLDLP